MYMGNTDSKSLKQIVIKVEKMVYEQFISQFILQNMK